MKFDYFEEASVCIQDMVRHYLPEVQLGPFQLTLDLEQGLDPLKYLLLDLLYSECFGLTQL